MSKNWRAALALLVAVTPSMPGLINSINKNVQIGRAVHIFDLAWIYGFCSASSVYYVTSVLFPARETILDVPIYGDEERRDVSVEEIPIDVDAEKRSASIAKPIPRD